MNPLMAMMMTGLTCLSLTTMISTSLTPQKELTPKEKLGKELFFDADLSQPGGQSCATCHDASVGFTGPDSKMNQKSGIYEGAMKGRFGNRKPPAASYAGTCPQLSRDVETGNFVGGLFWDGRANGWKLGDPVAEQAQGPFLNPLEQNLADAAAVVTKVAASKYAPLFKEVWGPESLSLDKNNIDLAFERIARSLAAYERSAEVNPFSSKYDAYLAHHTELSKQEKLGLELFEGKGKCANCHIVKAGADGQPPVFTDFTYDNLGVPKNLDNPHYKIDKEFNPDGKNWIDKGLGGYLATVPKYAAYAEANIGKHKVPTLRNVDKRPCINFVKVYGHNGYFKSLKEVVHFYNTRDVAGAGWKGKPWPAPEVAANVNKTEMGNLGLTDEEEEAIVAFMKTLNDGYWALAD